MTVSFVAEVSSNHHRDLNRCLRFIDTAAELGCAAVKFQLFKVAELFAPEILAVSPSHSARSQWELPLSFLPSLAQRCRTRKIQFSCTPFSLQAVLELLPHIDFYKIASYELLWDDLLAACAQTGKPVVLSTGMATLAEVEHAVCVLREHGCATPMLLHCVSGYPTPVGECNLAAMETLRRRVNCPVGWSDHTVSPAVIHRAVHRWGAEMVEFHLDLDGQGEEFKTGHCWLPEPMRELIASIATGELADGDGHKTPMPSELADRNWRADPVDGLRPLRSRRDEFASALMMHSTKEQAVK